MNYCNPSYSNNGVLSAEDTDALRRYYGSPAFGSDAKGEALLAAAWRGDLDGVRRNLTPETFKSTSPEGLNALMMAADRCNIDMALFLLNSGVLSAFDVNRRNAWKNTALEIARGTPKEKRDQGLDEPRCIALAPILQSFGGQ